MYGPVVLTVALMAREIEAPAFTVPGVQRPVTLSYAPPPVSPTYVKPAGKRSVTATPVAALGPALATMRVNTTVPPNGGAGVSTTLVSDRSEVRIGAAAT